MTETHKKMLADLFVRFEQAPNFDFRIMGWGASGCDLCDVEAEYIATCADRKTRDLLADALNLLYDIAEEAGCVK